MRAYPDYEQLNDRLVEAVGHVWSLFEILPRPLGSIRGQRSLVIKFVKLSEV
jgi:hypothetical protein